MEEGELGIWTGLSFGFDLKVLFFGLADYLTQPRRYRHLFDQCRPPCPLTAPKHARRLMDGAEKGEKSEQESLPLKIDPKWYV